jgi:hypothetical protein
MSDLMHKPVTCTPDEVASMPSPVMSNAEPAMSDIRETMCDTPDVAEKGPKKYNFMAELMAEDAAKNAEDAKWLDQPKNGYATGRGWAEAKGAELSKQIDAMTARKERLWGNVRDQHHNLTDADAVGRGMNMLGSLQAGGPPVQKLLTEADQYCVSAETLLSRARFDATAILPNYPKHSQMIGNVYALIGQANHALVQGESKLNFAIGTGAGRAGLAKQGLTATKYVGKVAGAMATGGQSMAAGAAWGAAGEAGNQVGNLLADDDVTRQDLANSAAHVGGAAIFGAASAGLPDIALGEGTGKVVEGMLKSAGGTAVESMYHNGLDGKPMGDGQASGALEAAGLSLIPGLEKPR